MTLTKKETKKLSSSNSKSLIFSKTPTKNVKKLKLKVGDISTVTITALGSKNIGLAEISNGYTVVVPKAKLGQQVKVQIEKISLKPKYAIAKMLEVITETVIPVPVQVEEILEIKTEKAGPKGSALCLLNNKFTIIVQPNSSKQNVKVNENLKVRITRVKKNYAFATVLPISVNNKSFDLQKETDNNSLKVGSTFNIKLPLQAKRLTNYVIIRLKNSLVFVKLSLGVQLGETVRIQIVKTTSKYAMAKTTKINPTSKASKQLLVKNNVKKMITAGMHYGEKAIRCHANMRKFLWIRKKGKNQNRPLMKRGRHIINVLKTHTCLNQSLFQLSKYAAKGKTFLFVGTKKPAASLIARTAMLSKTSYFVNTRWLGGMLTNWKTILKSISQIRPILKEKQKMIQKILEKRQKIKKRLLKKVNLLRKKSENLLFKGKQLLSQLKKDRNNLVARSQKLALKKEELIRHNQRLLATYSALKQKKQYFVNRTNLLQETGNRLIKQKLDLLQQIDSSKIKLEEFKQLNTIAQEVLKLKTNLKTQGKNLWTIPFENLTQVGEVNENWNIPNPSLQVLNKLIYTMKLKYNKNLLLLKNSDANVSTVTGRNRSKSTNNTVLISRLLNKLTDCLPFIQTYMKSLVAHIQTLQTVCVQINTKLQEIREKIGLLRNSALIAKCDSNLNLLKLKLETEQQNLKLLKQKLKQLSAEQKLLKFLPKLRYLPTSKKKMLETVEFLMKKFVDPKMSYSIDQVYDQKLKFTSKKLAATRKQKWQRLEKYFGGITKMAKMKRKQIANNVVILVGQQEEMNAVRECRKLGMKMFTLVDTNCNPRLSDYIIPTNDDSRNSIKFVLGQMLTYIRLGQKLRKKILAKGSI